jgi:hypothetical protein
VDAHGRAEGLLSVDDLVLHAGEPGLPLAVVFDALRAIAAAETGRAAAY